MGSGNGVQDQVQRFGGGCHGLRITGNNKVISSKFTSCCLLLPVRGDGSHSVPHFLGQPQPHLTESTQAQDSNIEAALGSAESLERSEHCNAGAKDWSGQLQRV